VIEHEPLAEHEAHALLFEPAATRNTGNVDDVYPSGERHLDDARILGA